MVTTEKTNLYLQNSEKVCVLKALEKSNKAYGLKYGIIKSL